VTGALEGIRVLDLGLLVQGPQAAAMLADLGADVIKVELPGFGDQARWIGSSLTDPRPPYFIGVNRGKRSVTIDLRKPEGKAVFRRLADTADVVISNFKGGTMDEWGLGYDVLSATNPRLVYATGSVYGPEGPLASAEGADLAGQAAGGLISTTGTVDGHPTPNGVTIADHIASTNMTVGILAALLARHGTGRGQRVDVSLVGGQIYAQASELTAFFLTGQQARPANYGHPLLHAIYGIFQTSDGWIAMVGVPPALKPAFCQAIGMPELADDPRIQALFLDPREKPAVFEILSKAFITDTTDNWVAKLRALGQRVAPVNDYARVAADEHNHLNGYLFRTEHPTYGPVTMVGNPIRLSDTPAQPGVVAPELGQDTELVLLEMGYGWEEIGALRESGAI
jgi:crotonobetainyl-CoA:carnitine CoA-transferase CaiB-like acyl-CoA transferase